MTDPAFGRRLRYLRLSVGLTGAELARRCGLSRQTVSKLEVGWHGPSWRTVLRLAKTLGVSTEDLRGEEVKPLS